MSTAEDGQDLVGKVKSTVSGVVDLSGDKIAQVVDKVTDTLDSATGGSTSALTAKADEAVFGAVGKALDASRAVTKKATDVVAGAKDAVVKPPETS